MRRSRAMKEQHCMEQFATAIASGNTIAVKVALDQFITIIASEVVRGGIEWARLILDVQVHLQHIVQVNDEISADIVSQVNQSLSGLFMLAKAVTNIEVSEETRDFLARTRYARQILKCLDEFGDLRYTDIRALLDPTPNPNALTYTLVRLVSNGLIRKGCSKRSDYFITAIGKLVLAAPNLEADLPKVAAMTKLSMRRANNEKLERVQNALLPFGVPWHYYCVSCGSEVQQLPSNHAASERKYLCDECQELADKGWI